tara:strand:- start:82 stop:687 length:606 start_codon:yes stop_codon:yes gene_type:complete
MIKTVYIILSLNLLISSSHGSGVLKNIIIPGWGFEQLENHQNTSKRYFLTEASIWASFITSRASSDLFEDYYVSYGIDYSNADILSYDEGYSINVGNYDSMYEYNQAMLRKRRPDDVYPSNQGYNWEWNSSNKRLKYKKMLQVSRDLDKIGDFAIASLIIHRAVSVINYMYYAQSGSNSKISSSVSKPDQNTVQLKIKYNF